MSTALRDADPPKLQLRATLASISTNNPIFVIHELKIDRLKFFIPYSIFDCGNNSILLSSIPNSLHFNLRGLREEHHRPSIAEHRRPIRLRKGILRKAVSHRNYLCDLVGFLYILWLRHAVDKQLRC